MRVLLVDDHTTLRSALREMLHGEPEFEVVAEAENGAQALELVDAQQPDLVLMDINMPVLDGIAATTVLRERHPQVRVVALSSLREASSVSAMIGAGARGYLLKTAPPDEILQALRAALDGRPVLAPEVLQGVLDDLGALYRAQRARADGLTEVDRLKHEFISLISDELRTPLTAITGYVSTLRNGWERIDEQTRQEFLDGIGVQTAHLNRRLEQILAVAAFGRRDAGDGRPFRLDEAAREVLDRLAPRLAGRPVRTDLQPVVVVADRDAVVGAALTLLENAIDHGRGRIRVRTGRGPEAAELTVTDDGPGLDAGTRERLAGEPFLLHDASDTRAARGLGLSLFIARRALEGSAGTLQIDSAAGRGSAVTILLPPGPPQA